MNKLRVSVFFSFVLSPVFVSCRTKTSRNSASRVAGLFSVLLSFWGFHLLLFLCRRAASKQSLSFCALFVVVVVLVLFRITCTLSFCSAPTFKPSEPGHEALPEEAPGEPASAKITDLGRAARTVSFRHRYYPSAKPAHLFAVSKLPPSIRKLCDERRVLG